jgi:hypothetical protein
MCLLAVLSAGRALAAAPAACGAPPDLARPRPLDHVAQRLRGRAGLDILAVGSLTLTNPDPLSPQAAFPFQMADTLRDMHVGGAITLTVRGGRGLAARDMLALIRTALAERPYQLVIWQTGAVDAVHGVKPADFAAALAEGADLVAARAADLVLVDIQYSRLIARRIDVAPYEDAMRRVAGRSGVALFPRYELMRFWASQGVIDLEHVPRSGRVSAMGKLQSCLGDTLARLVAGGVAAAD